MSIWSSIDDFSRYFQIFVFLNSTRSHFEFLSIIQFVKKLYHFYLLKQIEMDMIHNVPLASARHKFIDCSVLWQLWCLSSIAIDFPPKNMTLSRSLRLALISCLQAELIHIDRLSASDCLTKGIQWITLCWSSSLWTLPNRQDSSNISMNFDLFIASLI